MADTSYVVNNFGGTAPTAVRLGGELKKKARGTYQIATICHVAPITVGRWIAEGKLPHFTTGGGHRRVWQGDLLKFLQAHNYPLPKNLRDGGPAILIVEDDATTRRLIRRI